MECVKTCTLTTGQALAIQCPTCGSSPGMLCEVGSGGLRNSPHRNRKLGATQAIELALARQARRVRLERMDHPTVK